MKNPDDEVDSMLANVYEHIKKNPNKIYLDYPENHIHGSMYSWRAYKYTLRLKREYGYVQATIDGNIIEANTFEADPEGVVE